MGREIRRVPAEWQHPLLERPNYYCCRNGTCRGPHYQPLFDKSYREEAEKWLENAVLWSRGEHPDQKEYESSKESAFFWEWSCQPPDPDYYRPEWTDEERTHFQMYETVSEGTPVSPVFATLEELSDWLVGEGYTKEQADAFCNRGWGPSFMQVDGGPLLDAVQSAEPGGNDG